MTNRYFDFPNERLTLCVGVKAGSVTAKAKPERIRDYFGKTGKIREIDSTEYTRLTDIYTHEKYFKEAHNEQNDSQGSGGNNY